ncbi:MAG: MBL fold metallo-hydrolase [Clostridiales bacterium]|nr:MBL fold metallo-hydrolase [Clostridiales bacterium]
MAGKRKKKKRRGKRTPADIVGLIDRISLLVLIVSLAAVYCITAVRMTGTVYPTKELLDGRAAIRFLDVGQADCTLITHRGHAVLIDAGSAYASSATAQIVSRYAPHIDAFFVTHPHEDHMGGAPAVLRASVVEALYLSAAVSHESFYEDTVRTAERRKTDVVTLSSGGTWTFGDITVECFDTFGFGYEDLNDASLILRVSVDGMTLLIAGDAERGLEGYAVDCGFDLHASILHVNHHGSSSSSTERWIDAVSPKIAVISCGRNNAFGHPSMTVLDRLRSRGIAVLRTDRDGTVVLRGGEWER